MGNKKSKDYDPREKYAESSDSQVLKQPATANKHAQRFSHIPDQYKTLDQVITALRESGLESSNLIVGIDFTKSNEWTGKYSFNRRSLHEIGSIPNPYEQAMSIIGRTLSPFDEDNMIPCFGFGDAFTHDHNVFSFFPDHRPCHGFEEALTRYREIVPHLRLAGCCHVILDAAASYLCLLWSVFSMGPTSFAPIINVAVDIVERSGGQYHVLVIIADGQVTRSTDTEIGCLSSQEKKTIDAIVAASQYPLSIVLVGVGDGPWEAMQQFDDNIPRRIFDNFQFVNFTSIMYKSMELSEKEAAFALAALMEIPSQYKATQELHLLGQCVGSAPGIVPFPPPLPVIQHDTAMQTYPHSTSFQYEASRSTSHGEHFHQEGSLDSREQVCPICLTKPRDMAFGCGHMTCKDCGENLSYCPLCRAPISTRLRLYSG